MKKIKVIVGIDKSELIKGDKRIVACGKNFETTSFGIKSIVVEHVNNYLLYDFRR